MERVFTELTPECEITARMYEQGYEKKEIANLKCRALSTVSNQIQTAMRLLHVRNGREPAIMLYERLTGMKITMDFSPVARSVVACCLLCVFSITFYQDFHSDMRRARRIRETKIEYRIRDYDSSFK